MHKQFRYAPWLLPLLLTPLGASATEEYLCAQLDRIRAEENVPSIGAGLILPDPDYPQYSPLQFVTITCASGVQIFGAPQKVTSSTQFGIGSIAKPLTGLVVARVIAAESKKRNPMLTWDTRLIDFFPHIATLPGVNPCYGQRTVADLMAHTTAMPGQPATEPGDQWASIEPDIVARRARYVDAAVIDMPVMNCIDSQGQPLAQLGEAYAGGSIIAAHMAEVVTGRSWEDLVRHAGSTTAGPGLMIGLLPDPALPPDPYAYGHSYASDGTPFVNDLPGPAPTNGPAGNILPTVPQFARILTEFLDATADDVNRQLPDAERAGLLTRHGLSSFNRLGWQVRTLDTDAFGSVANWYSTASLWHNGGNDRIYDEAYLVPHQNAGMFALLNADGPYDAAHNLLLQNRPRAMAKVFSELTALRLHHGEAADIVLKRKPATVRVDGLMSKAFAGLGDGRLSSKWTATSASPATITLTYPEATSIDRIVIAEDGNQRIRRYELSYQDPNGTWHVIAKNDPNEDLIFPHRVFKVSTQSAPPQLFGTSHPIYAKQLRLKILQATGAPEIVEFAAANVPNDTPYRPLWWRQGFAEALPQPGPILDPGPLLPGEVGPIFEVNGP